MKLNFMVQGQCITLSSLPGCIVGGSINYLDASFVFSREWEGTEKIAFFVCGDKRHEALIGEDGCIREGINLGAGVWSVHVIGTMSDGVTVQKRIPTMIQTINVQESGIDEANPFPEIPATLAEQILARSLEALNTANAVKAAADAGEFDGGYYKPEVRFGYLYWTPSKEGMPEVVPTPIPEGGGGGGGTNLPAVTEADNGKVMTVVDGKWEAAELPKYAGAYEVTPSAHEETTLNTAATYMDADVKVKKIPYYETTNEKGGDTVYIGSEV